MLSHTAKLIVSMCSRKESSGIKVRFLKKIKKSNDLQRQQLSALCSLPGVGEKLAVRMLGKIWFTTSKFLLQHTI